MNPSDAGAAVVHNSAERVAPVIYLFGKAQSSDARGTTPPVEPLQAELPHAERVAATRAVPASEASSPKVVPRSVESRGVGGFEPISNASMYALGRRAMSAAEMSDYLSGRDFDAEEVDVEIERLENVGLLDDMLLAEELATSLRQRKGLGRSAITAELKRRQLNSMAIAQVFEGGADDELEQATALALKRAPQLRALDATTARRRLGDFLMRKGYSGQVVSKAVQVALAPASSGGPTFR